MELWKLPTFTGTEFAEAISAPPEEMSVNEKQSWREGFHAGFGFLLTKGECLGILTEVCEHEWVDVSNEVIESGEWCVRCNAIREGQ